MELQSSRSWMMAVLLCALWGAGVGTAVAAGGDAKPAAATKASATGSVGGMKYAQRDHGVAPLSQQRGTAQCQKHGNGGWYVTGGGASVSGNAAEAYLFESYWDHHGRIWHSSAYNGSGPQKTLTTYAICKKRAKKGQLDAVEKTVQAPTTGPFTVEVGCKGNRVVMGGGAFVPNFWINSSLPFDGPDQGAVPDDGWEVRAYAAGGAGVTAFAVCKRKRSLGGTLKYVTDSAVAGGVGSADAGCGPNRVVTGGGVDTTGDADQAFVNATAPVDSPGDPDAIPDDGWRAIVANNSGPSKTITVFAICKRK
jgi:hypothetical protein